MACHVSCTQLCFPYFERSKELVAAEWCGISSTQSCFGMHSSTPPPRQIKNEAEARQKETILHAAAQQLVHDQQQCLGHERFTHKHRTCIDIWCTDVNIHIWYAQKCANKHYWWYTTFASQVCLSWLVDNSGMRMTSLPHNCSLDPVNCSLDPFMTPR